MRELSDSGKALQDIILNYSSQTDEVKECILDGLSFHLDQGYVDDRPLQELLKSHMKEKTTWKRSGLFLDNIWADTPEEVEKE